MTETLQLNKLEKENLWHANLLALNGHEVEAMGILAGILWDHKLYSLRNALAKFVVGEQARVKA